MIYFFYGENTFTARQAVDDLTAAFLAGDRQSRHDIEILDGEKLEPELLYQATSTIGFLSNKKLIIIKNIFANKKLASWQDTLLKFLDEQNKNDSANDLIFWQAGKPDARLKLYKKLVAQKNVREFVSLKPKELPEWIKNQVAKNQKQISAEAISALINFVGSDLWQLSQEINKLVSYCPKNIELNDVRTLVHAKLDDNIFKFVDALGNKNKALALKLLEEQLQSGQDKQYLITMITRQYRLLLKSKALEKSLANSYALAQKIKVDPFVAQKIWEQSRAYNIGSLKRIYFQLLELDEKFKTSSANDRLLFYQLIKNI